MVRFFKLRHPSGSFRKRFKDITIICLWLAFCGLIFQNCDEGFEAVYLTSNGLNSGDNGDNGDNNSSGVFATFSDWSNCRDQAGLEGIAGCLQGSEKLPEGMTQADVDECVTAVGKADVLVTECLAARKFYFHGYRWPSQADVDECAASGGQDKIAQCLEKNGVNYDILVSQAGISQANIDTCVINVGIGNVEKCLRANAFIPQKKVFHQGEVSLCLLTHDGDSSQLATCLDNAGLLPNGVDQAEINLCATSHPDMNLTACLRDKKRISIALMQHNVNTCANFVGQENIATCLEENALNPEGVDQTVIDECINSVGVGNIVKCLRNNGHIENSILQPHISACADYAGQTNVAACLDTNGLLPENVVQTDVDECINGVGMQNVRRCFVMNEFISNIPTQLELSACAYYAGVDGIADCLDLNGILPIGLDQEQIDDCLQGSGLEGLAACLKENAFIGPTYQELIADTGIFGKNCVECHGTEGNMNIANYNSLLLRVVPGDPANSILFQRLNGVGGKRMPPAESGKSPLSQLERDKVRRWILEGAKNN